MKRLFRVSLDIFVTSSVPILSWFLLGMLLDRNLINIFSLTYPLQCVMGIIISVFGVGANICIYKDNNKNAADNGIFYGTLFSIIVFGYTIWKHEQYITFMNMEIEIYRIFGLCSMFQIFLQTVLQLILTKLYYEEKNKKANKIAVLFNVMNFMLLISIALLTKNQMITAVGTSIVMLVFIVILLVKNVKKIDFNINLKHCLKYDSVSVSVSFMFFIMYLFGFSNSFAYGEKYMLAITFATLVTDMQWDITGAIKTVAKVDIAKKQFTYQEHVKNATKLILILISSVLVMSAVLYPFYQPDIKIVSIFVFLHILDFLVVPFTAIKVCFLQLEDSAFKMTSNMIIAYVIRTLMSFLPTPFCTIIGQMSSCIYEWICTKINYRKYEIKKINRKAIE